MKKGIIISLAVCVLWLAVPCVAGAWVEKYLQGTAADNSTPAASAKSGTVQWGDRKAITPTETVTIEWEEGRPTPLSA